MNKQNLIKNRGVCRTTNRTIASEKEHFSQTFVPEYSETPKNHAHTFPLLVTRAFIYLFSVSP